MHAAGVHRRCHQPAAATALLFRGLNLTSSVSTGRAYAARQATDGIEQLAGSHRKHLRERSADEWKADFFLIGWDGAGHPFGIDRTTGELVAEPEGSDGKVRRLHSARLAALSSHLQRVLDPRKLCGTLQLGQPATHVFHTN